MLADPKIFNYIMVLLCFLAAGRLAAAGSWFDVWYFISAASITLSVTLR